MQVGELTAANFVHGAYRGVRNTPQGEWRWRGKILVDVKTEKKKRKTSHGRSILPRFGSCSDRADAELFESNSTPPHLSFLPRVVKSNNLANFQLSIQ